MDLNEQAERAVNALFAEVGVGYSEDGHRAAKMIWLDGFKAGMDAARHAAVSAIAASTP
jgi:hypothetical protein